ncbi:MAG: hypothetical protein V3V28_01870 [Polaribacter sp.]|uniref:tetratricopeptide repeat protein n=1 Tax=Polaribacter sp. TaxID=1920175 RepID=UPI002F355F35
MIFRIKKQKTRKERQFKYIKLPLFSLFFILFSINSFSQDSIPEATDLTEEKELKFQQYFFKALSEKSIGNYQKAIQNLESCNQILANEVSIYFEFSKNYLLLNNTLLSKEYIHRALKKDINNLWMLMHLVKINVKDRNFVEAILNQKKVVIIEPKEKPYLVRLYLQNREYDKAHALMLVLEEENNLPASLKRLKSSLEKQKINTVVEKKADDVSSLKEKFKTDKSYKILEQILKESVQNSNDLLKYSEEGITLFPAQPFVYLMKGRALNYQKNYKRTLTTLNNGIDFVIEDAMEAKFYQEMAIAHKGLGNLKEEKKYKEKSKKLKS